MNALGQQALNPRLFDGQQQVPAALEGFETRAADRACGERRVLEALQAVVARVNDQRRRADGGDAFVGHRRPVVERGAGGARRHRVHAVDQFIRQLPLRRRQTRRDLVIDAHQAEKARAGRLGDRPIDEVMPKDLHQQVALRVGPLLLRRVRRRHAGRQQRQRRHALRIQRGEQQCRGAAVRERDHRDAIDAEMIEQVRIGVRLVVEGGAGARRRAQVAEARGDDEAQAVAEGRARKELALVEAPAAAVDHQHRRRRSALGAVLDATERRVDDLAAAFDARIGARHVIQVSDGHTTHERDEHHARHQQPTFEPDHERGC
jgi:hypothetical protein